MAKLMFDATQVDPATAGGSQLPVSDANGHPVVIVASEFKPTKDDPQYGYLQLDLEVIDGPHKGERGPYRLNLYNKEPKAVDIAQRQLSAICHVVNVFRVQDSAELHNKPFRVIVGLQKGDNPDKYTEVKGVKDINGNDPGKGGQPANNTNQGGNQGGFNGGNAGNANQGNGGNQNGGNAGFNGGNANQGNTNQGNNGGWPQGNQGGNQNNGGNGNNGGNFNNGNQGGNANDWSQGNGGNAANTNQGGNAPWQN